MDQLLDDPSLMLSLVALFFNLAILGILYPTLKATSRTGQLRFLVRFMVIWNIGDMGSRWGFSSDYVLLHMISEIVLLLGMVTMGAMWPHLAWLSVMVDRKESTRNRLDVYQMVLYIVCIVFLLVGILTRTQERILPYPYHLGVLIFLLACLIWSVARFLGPGLTEAPSLERRSRVMLGIGTSVMFFFILNDLILSIMLMDRIDVAVLLSPIAMAIMGYGFLVKSKYLVSAVLPKGAKVPDDKEAKAPRKAKGMGKEGTRYLLRPGKVYIDLSGGKGLGPDIMMDQVGRGRRGFALTMDPDRFRKRAGLKGLPAARLLKTRDGGSDRRFMELSSDIDLEMMPYMIEEFAFEASLEKDAEGSIVVFDGLNDLFKDAGRKRARKFIRSLHEVVKRSDELRLVLLGSSKGLGKRAKAVGRMGFPIRSD
jgi:hypothetical protein